MLSFLYGTTLEKHILPQTYIKKVCLIKLILSYTVLEFNIFIYTLILLGKFYK